MVTTKQLTEAFQEASNILAHDISVTAEFSPYRDLKIRWKRTYGAADFSVSDYLQEAPMEVIEGIARTIFSSIANEETERYPDATEQWLTSEEFRSLNQRTYIERSRSIDRDADTSRLEKAYECLLYQKLIEPIEDLKLFWSTEDRENKAGQSSALMRVVIMNRKLLDDNVPEEALDYCLLHEIANTSLDFGLDFVERKKDVENLLATCPEREAAKEWLKKAMIEV